MKTILLTLLFASLALGQITVDVSALNISADGTSALYAWMLNQQSSTTTFLALDCTASATSITVQDSSGIGVALNRALLIGGEAVTVTAKTGKVLTITRAQLGTLAAAHRGTVATKDAEGVVTVVNAGDLVTVLKYPAPQSAVRQWIVDKMAELMAAGGYPTAAAQDAIINTAKAAKDAAIAGAVQ